SGIGGVESGGLLKEGVGLWIVRQRGKVLVSPPADIVEVDAIDGVIGGNVAHHVVDVGMNLGKDRVGGRVLAIERIRSRQGGAGNGAFEVSINVHPTETGIGVMERVRRVGRLL